MPVEKTERLINLTMALLATERPLRKSEVFALVGGYEASPETNDRMFERDKDDLRKIGVPVEVFEIEAGMDSGYRIRSNEYAIAPLDFTPEEAELLAIAADAWKRSGFTAQGSATILKLQGAGVPVIERFESRVELNFPAAWLTCAQALSKRVSIAFVYRSRLGALSDRRLQPYSLIARQGRWYLIGRDEERLAIRTFALSRIVAEVREISEKPHDIPADFDAEKEFGKIPKPSTQVRIQLPTGLTTHFAAREGAAILETQAQDSQKTTEMVFCIDDEEEFIFEVLSLAPHIEVKSPHYLRLQICDQLKHHLESRSHE